MGIHTAKLTVVATTPPSSRDGSIKWMSYKGWLSPETLKAGWDFTGSSTFIFFNLSDSIETPKGEVPPGPVIPPKGEVPPGPVIPPKGEVPPGPVIPPKGEVPPGPAIPPKEEVPPGPAIPPKGEVPPGPAIPPKEEVPPGPAIPPKGEVPPGPAIPPKEEISPGQTIPLFEELLQSGKDVIIVAPPECRLHNNAASHLGFKVARQASPQKQPVILSMKDPARSTAALFEKLKKFLGYDDNFRTFWTVSDRHHLESRCIPVCELQETKKPVIVSFQGKQGSLTLVPGPVNNLTDENVHLLHDFVEATKLLVVRVRVHPLGQESIHLHTAEISSSSRGKTETTRLAEPYTKALLAFLKTPRGPVALSDVIPKKDQMTHPTGTVNRLNDQFIRLIGVPFVTRHRRGVYEISGRLQFDVDKCPVKDCDLNNALPRPA